MKSKRAGVFFGPATQTGILGARASRPLPRPALRQWGRGRDARAPSPSAYLPRVNVTNPSRLGIATFGNDCAFIVSLSGMTPLRLSK